MSADSPSRGRRAGPLGLLLALLVLGVLWLLLFARMRAPGVVDTPVVSDPDQRVPAFVAELVAADGSTLHARLAPLHGDPDRQAFERDTLRRRFELPDGEPWRLSLEWRRGATANEPGPGEGGNARFGERGPARGEPAGAAQASLGLGDVRVEDAAGPALVPLLSGAAGDAPDTDPLRTLLGSPGGSLGRGQAVDWVLWGRRPDPGARLVGLLPPSGAEEQAEFAAATGLVGELIFEARPVSRRDLLLPLARLERGDREAPAPAGKKPGTGASEEP